MISTYSFQVSTQDSKSRFNGRSWGRQRPISSHLDLLDAQQGWDWYAYPDSIPLSDMQTPTAGLELPNNRSPFRTMEWDGFISIKSTVYPRQNQRVPSSLWAPGFSQQQQLPVLDYWEKGDIIEFEIEPLHLNNAGGGNVQAYFGAMPYQDGSFDGHEGVMYPGWNTEGTPDPIQRMPSGILVVGFSGFRILQPPGVRVR